MTEKWKKATGISQGSVEKERETRQTRKEMARQ